MMDSHRRTVRIIATATALMGAVMLTALSTGVSHAAPVKVTAVTLRDVADEVRVSIMMSGPAGYQERVVRPQWIVLDILGAELTMPPGRLPLAGGPVSQVRVGQFAPDVVRIVVEMTQRVHVHLAASPDGSALVVGIPALGSGGQTRPAATARGDDVQNGIAKITAITVWGPPSKPWVSMTASGPVRYQLRNIESDWIVLDVSRAELALASRKPPAGRGLVKQIRMSQFAPDVVRVVLELAQHVPAHIAMSSNNAGIVVSFAPAARTHVGSTRAPGDSVPPVFAPQAAASRAPAASAQPAASAPAPSSQHAAARPSASTAQAVVNLPPASAGQTAARPSDGGYLLGPEDVLEITVWGYGDLTRIVPVRPDGQISVPLAGTVPAAGRSVERLTQDLTRAYAKYIINPQVTASVKEFRKIRISMLGQVARPGTYTLPPGARILDAISIASGVTDNAALPQAQLVRASGETRLLSLDGLLLRQDLSQNLVVEPGDTLIIPEDTTNKFYVLGDVSRPGIYPIKGDVTVLQAIATAGGPVMHGTSTSQTAHIVRHLNPRDVPLTAGVHRDDVQSIANGNGVMITKDLHKMYQGDLRQNEALQPGDVLVVPAPGVAALPTILSVLGLFWWFHL